MSELPSFRSSFNGFNRSDVIEFLKKLLDEKSALTEQLSALKDENAALQAELENCKAQISGIESERQTEEQLGRTMCDARRFSDMIVQEANDKAQDILDSALKAANDVSGQVDGISAQISDLTSRFGSSIGDINDCLTALSAQLSRFGSDTEEKKLPYCVTPDAVLTTPAAAEKEESAAPAEDAEDDSLPEPEEAFVFGSDDEDGADDAPLQEKQTQPVRLTVKKVKRSHGGK